MNSHLISRGVGSAGIEASQRDPCGPSVPVSQHVDPQLDNRPKVETRPPREPSPPPGEDMVFEANELLNYLMPVWERLYKSDYAMPFRTPVDPLLLGIPEYLDIVKRPMDLSTIFAKLDRGEYKNTWEFCDDMWLMFDNAWLYNKKNNRVYMCSTKLSELFVEVMNPVMKKMGYCCSQKLAFTPLDLFCYGASMCTIARDQPYLCYETSSTQFNVTISDRYTYCQKCFDALPDEGMSLSENPADRSNMVAKTEFKLLQNNQIDMEPFENCKYCKRKWHKICALHDKKIFPEGFICETCRTQKNIPKAENKFTAKNLAHCNLSSHLEDRVNTYIKQRTTQMNLKGDYEVVIRVLCAQEKEVEVKPLMKAKYCGEAGFPEKFPYKSKAVFAFEVIDGVEVCFFGLHVQEYGSSCGQPNQRQVYIASFDSVHFFEPRELRTDVYHEILLGYLDYAKKLGYSMAHIRACPPSEGNDYIFHCHPPEQKIPSSKRLQDWYKKMLEKGVDENCVVEFKESYKQAKDNNLMTPMDVPYFDGDFLPNVIEDCIRDANNEEALKRKARGGDDDEDDVFAAEDYGWRNLSTMNKKNQGSSTGNEVADKLFSEFEKHKEVFFTVRLINQQAEMQMRNIEIKDPDGLLSSGLMDCRFTFLTRARDEHWEFSSLRRAKFSTLSMCHALHDRDSSKVVNYTCNNCSSTSAKWHCTICEDFDLCDGCRQTEKHEHAMEPIKSLVDEYKDQAGGNNRIESIQRCIQSMVHACHCRDANCRKMSCHKMKRVVQHTKMCKKRQNSSCPLCKQLIALCCYHAKHCNRDGCQVPFCINMRQRLSERKRSMTRRVDMMRRCRMEGLRWKVNDAVSQSSLTHPGLGVSTLTSNQSNSPSQPAAVCTISTSGHGSMSHHMQRHPKKPSGIGMNQQQRMTDGQPRPGPGQEMPPQGRLQGGHINPPPSYDRCQMMQYAMQMAHNQMGMGQPEMGQPIGGPRSQQSYGQPATGVPESGSDSRSHCWTTAHLEGEKSLISSSNSQNRADSESNDGEAIRFPQPKLHQAQFESKFPLPEDPIAPMEWQLHFPKEMRIDFINKLFTILPTSNSSGKTEQSTKDLHSYARKIENAIFEIAVDREEYLHLLSEKMNKKKMDEKKPERSNEKEKECRKEQLQQLQEQIDPLQNLQQPHHMQHHHHQREKEQQQHLLMTKGEQQQQLLIELLKQQQEQYEPQQHQQQMKQGAHQMVQEKQEKQIQRQQQQLQQLRQEVQEERLQHINKEAEQQKILEKLLKDQMEQQEQKQQLLKLQLSQELNLEEQHQKQKDNLQELLKIVSKSLQDQQLQQLLQQEKRQEKYIEQQLRQLQQFQQQHLREIEERHHQQNREVLLQQQKLQEQQEEIKRQLQTQKDAERQQQALQQGEQLVHHMEHQLQQLQQFQQDVIERQLQTQLEAEKQRQQQNHQQPPKQDQQEQKDGNQNRPVSEPKMLFTLNRAVLLIMITIFVSKLISIFCNY